MMAIPKSWRAYLGRHWFKLLCVVLTLFILMQKDISLRLQLHAPERKQPPKEEIPDPGKENLARSADRLSEAGPSSREANQFDLGGWLRRPKAMPEYEALQRIAPEKVQAFLDRFRQVAYAEEEKFGIPANLTLANALLLSRAGQALITGETNNFFLLPCTGDWAGEKDHYDGLCLRKYENAWMSFRDHSLYLTTGKHAEPGKFRGRKAGEWVDALEKNGYAHVHHYADQIRATLQHYFKP